MISHYRPRRAVHYVGFHRTAHRNLLLSSSSFQLILTLLYGNNQMLDLEQTSPTSWGPTYAPHRPSSVMLTLWGEWDGRMASYGDLCLEDLIYLSPAD